MTKALDFESDLIRLIQEFDLPNQLKICVEIPWIQTPDDADQLNCMGKETLAEN